MSRRNKNRNTDNGFEEWGGYMAAKKAKLAEQYKEVTCSETKQISDIFKDIAIFVNGYTNPSAEELKALMASHGGIYQIYQSSGSKAATTHIIASNLPNVKIKQLGNVPIVKPNWITDSIAAEKLLDYRKYLLYTNLDRKQPVLNFPVVTKPPDSTTTCADLDPITTEELKIKQDSEPKPQTSRTLTAADPRFLAEFYNNSRLHLISTLGAEYKQLVCQLREKSNGIFPGREKLAQLNGSAFVNNEPVVMHIDMDCFFVSVGVRNRPHLRGHPVAVTHARSSQGNINRSDAAEAEIALYKKYFSDDGFEEIDPRGSMSEIASCSYEARKCGVKNGMFLGKALTLCPNLQTIPYDFQGYREVSTILYNTIAAYTLDIEAVSCDEMYVDIGPLLHEAAISVQQWATHIRKEIMDSTGCPCSTGFGANRLQARLATKKAKPAGQFYLQQHEVEEYMATTPLADLPGVGHATLTKLSGLGLKTCGDVQTVTLSRLQAELGLKAGETLLEQARGIDRKPLNFQHERKSVSADVNYGIRFKDKTEALNFLLSLATEVCSRLQDVGMRARCLTLKLLVRAPEAPQETAKFLGCGVCTAVNRSTTTGGLMSDAATIYREAKALFERVNVPPPELRGVGIQLTRLEKTPPVNSALSRFLQQTSDKKEESTTNKSSDKEAFTKNIECADKQMEEAKEDPLLEEVNKNLVIGEQNEAPLQVQPNSVVPSDNPPTKPLTITSKGNQSSPIKKQTENNKKQTGAAPKTKASKKGRPKMSVNNKCTKKPINDLDKYFKPQKHTRLPVKDIDLDVLNELPEELRQEIIKEYQLEEKATPTSCPKGGCEKKDNFTVDLVKDITDENLPKTSTSATPSAFAGLDWEELKPIILNWLNSETEPTDIDVAMIAEYFKQLALDRKIENLKKMLSFLYRHVARLGRCPWHEAYWTIINTVQEGMVACYGSTLYVERHFVCSVHS